MRPLYFLAICVATALFLDAVQALSRPDLGFTTLASERLIEAYSERFGPHARAQLRAWKREAEVHKSIAARERRLLQVVNAYFNRLHFRDDIQHWGQLDYWGTPAESVASGSADCEDFAIAKYFFLKELGIPIEKLRLTYVKAIDLGQAHMVLAYYAAPDAEPLVLDNLDHEVRAASVRRDLLPVYSFNDEVVWTEASGRIGSPGQLRNWGLLVKHLEDEARSSRAGA